MTADVLTVDEETTLRRAIADDSVAGVARRMGVSSVALLSVLAGLARLSTTALVRAQLVKLAGAA